MINVILRGDLGNWLFQWSFAHSLATKHHCQIRLLTYNRWLSQGSRLSDILKKVEIFDLDHSVEFLNWPTLLEHKLPFIDFSTWITEAKSDNTDAIITPDKDTVLYGYFQSNQYFHSSARSVHEHLTRKPLSPLIEHSLLERCRQKNSVAIHVRRGDYLKSRNHNVCSNEYYFRAIEMMQTQFTDCHFHIFSDDLEYCRKLFDQDKFYFVDLDFSRTQPGAEIRLMAECHHQIISNSSFSWWGAWLNKRPGNMVICPDKWLNDEQLNQRAKHETILPQWIQAPH